MASGLDIIGQALPVRSRALTCIALVATLAGAIFGASTDAAAAESTADAPHFSLSPQALYAAASAPRTPDGTNVSMLEVQETYSFDADGGNLYTQYIVYKILTPAGAENWNALVMNWSPWRDTKPAMKARVIAADGTVYMLDPATIADAAAHAADSSIYSDERTARAPLPAIAPGAVVETEIVLKEGLPFPGAGKVGRSYFQMNDPIQHFRLTLQAPRTVPLRYRLDLLPNVTPAHTEENGTDRWVFDSNSMPAAEDAQAGLPSDTYGYPVVTFSTGSSWHDLAQEYSKIVAARLAQGNVNDLVARLTKGRSTRAEKAGAIVEYLNREIRYTGIEFDQASIFPHSPAETLGRKYGDCKDKSVLLAAMLRTAGIPANLALLNAGDRIDVPGELPGMGLFDHAIVYVPGEPAMWIDATDDNARLGQLPDMDRGRSALIVDTETTALTRVTEAHSTDNVTAEEREIYLADNGPARVVEISKPQGTFESEYRRAYANVADKDTKENLTDYVKSEYVAEHLDRVERSDPKDFSQPFRLTLESKRAARGDTSLSEAVTYIYIGGLFNGLPAELRTREPTAEENAKATHPKKPRTADYQITRPFVVEWNYRIVPPPGFQAAVLPADMKRDLGPAAFSENFSSDPDGSVRAVLRFDTVKRRFTVAEQSSLRNAIADLREAEAIRVKFDLRAHLLLTQGQARESFQAYRDLIAQHPKDAIQHLRRADALLQAGMGEAARTEARLAIKLDPKSAVAQETLATILQNDLIGRWHQPGADYAGAAAAYRAAIALDPDDKSRVANYAVLLEHDARGLRYGNGADLKGALAQYKTLSPAQLTNVGVSQNPVFAMFYSGDFAGAREAAEAVDSPPLGLITACDAKLKGVPQALEQARRRANGEAKYKETVAVAGQMLMNLREYAPAADLLEASASGPSTARVMGLVSLLRSTKRYEELKFANTPDDFIRQTMFMAMSEDSFEKQLAFYSRNAVLASRDLTPEEREAATLGSRTLLATAARGGSLPEVLIDLTMQSIQVKGSGSDAVGYREVLQIPSSRTQTIFVVKENDQYKMLDSSDHPVAIALEVLERAGRQDITGATTLLDWLRDAVPNDSNDDRYSGNPFLRFWTPGRGQSDVRSITLAAASLLVQRRRTAKQGITLLEQAKSAATTDAESENIDLALMIGYDQLKEAEHALAAAAALAKRTPDSRLLFHMQSTNLRALNRFADAEALAAARLQTRPEDIDALRARSTNAAAQHNYAAAYEQSLKVVANGNSGPGDMNELAWLTLFFDRAGGPDIDTALKASQFREGGAGMPLLHTLGCLYAEVGKTREAREVLLQSMAARNITQPNSDFWYAFGRIAEQYGERDIALADYAKVTPPKDVATEPLSTFQLAKNRIQILTARPK